MNHLAKNRAIERARSIVEKAKKTKESHTWEAWKEKKDNFKSRTKALKKIINQ